MAEQTLETLDVLVEDILAFVEERKIVKGTILLYHFVAYMPPLLIYADTKPFVENFLRQVRELVHNGKLQALYPPGVDPERAFLSQTYLTQMDDAKIL